MTLSQRKRFFSIQRYDWCLFLGHLIIEKVLKAFWVRDNPNVPILRIHNLNKLAEKTKLQFTKEQQTLLVQITQFNIEGRYPDYKFEFYKKCTLAFTPIYFAKIKELYQWLLPQI